MTRVKPRWTPAAAAAALLMVLAPTAHLAAQGVAADSARVALATELLVRMGAADQAIAAMDAMIATQRTANPRIPSVFWDRFSTRLRGERERFTGTLAAVYAKHFSAEDLRSLMAFYETPLGQHLLAEQPAIMQESMAVGRELGATLGREIGKQLIDEGVTIEN